MFSQFDSILIVSLRRSGGKLLRRSLDGHPRLSALPFEHWHTAKKARFPGPVLERFGELRAEEKLAVTGLSERAVWKNKPAKDAETQEAYLKRQLSGRGSHLNLDCTPEEAFMQGLVEHAERSIIAEIWRL
jgi:hypothetical protein